MDLANYSRSLSTMITHEIFRECTMACFNVENASGVPDKTCVDNCASKNVQLLTAFDKVVKTELPRLQELSRIY